MNASKENARKCLADLGRLEQGADLPNRMNQVGNIRKFLQAAERKLPTEAAYQRDKKRRREKAKA